MQAPPLNGHLGGVIFLAFRRGEGFAVLTVPNKKALLIETAFLDQTALTKTQRTAVPRVTRHVMLFMPLWNHAVSLYVACLALAAQMP